MADVKSAGGLALIPHGYIKNKQTKNPLVINSTLADTFSMERELSCGGMESSVTFRYNFSWNTVCVGRENYILLTVLFCYWISVSLNQPADTV